MNGNITRQYTFGGAAANVEYDGAMFGSEFYGYRTKFGEFGQVSDLRGSKGGFFTDAVNTSNYIDDDPAYILDIGGLEWGWDSNYNPINWVNNFIEGTKEYLDYKLEYFYESFK